ncbi:MAG: ThiF family adenylyltransferase [Bacteroidota bacterium]
MSKPPTRLVVSKTREYGSEVPKRERIYGVEKSGWDLEKIKSARIMVIGAGALGNEVLKNLGLIGVKNIFLIDFDIVEWANLSRSVLYREEDCSGDMAKVEVAAKRLKEINPEINIQTANADITIDIGLGVIRRMDVIIGCVDNRLARLYINRFCHWLGKPWIDGGILDFGGQADVYRPGEKCYECNLSKEAWENIRFRMGCVDRARRYASSGRANTIPLTSSIIGSIQVLEALKLIQNPDGKFSLGNAQFFFEGLSNEYLTLASDPVGKRCDSHTRFTDIISSPLTHSSTVKEMFAWLQRHFDHEDVVITLHYELILSLITESGDQAIDFVKPRPHVKDDELTAMAIEIGEEVLIHEHISEIEPDFLYPDYSLSTLGIPPLHILTIIANGEEYYVELTGDEAYLNQPQ